MSVCKGALQNEVQTPTKRKNPMCVIFTYTPPFIFQIPPELIVEIEVSSVTVVACLLTSEDLSMDSLDPSLSIP